MGIYFDVISNKMPCIPVVIIPHYLINNSFMLNYYKMMIHSLTLLTIEQYEKKEVDISNNILSKK